MQNTMTLSDSSISGLDETASATHESRLVDEARHQTLFELVEQLATRGVLT